MEAEDDDRSFTGDGDPLFAIDRNEDDLPSLLEHYHPHYEAKKKRVAGSAAAGGTLLSVPLVAVDVTVSLQGLQGGECKEDTETIATPQVEKVVRSANAPNRFPWAAMFRRGHSVDDTRKQEVETDDSSEFGEEESGEINFTEPTTTLGNPKEVEVEEEKAANVGLRAGGLMWIMSQRKALEEETEPREVLGEAEEKPEQDAGGLAWLMSQKKALQEETVPRELLEEREELPEDDTITTQKDEEKEPPRGPLGWLRRKNHAQAQASANAQADILKKNEPTHPETRKIEHMQGLKEAASAKHTWMARFQGVERDDTDSCDDEDYYSDGSSSYGSDSDSDSDYDSDDDSEYSSDESDSEEEEVVFAFDDSVQFTGTLFSDGIVEQADPIA